MTYEQLCAMHRYLREHAGISLQRHADNIGCAKNTLLNMETKCRSINTDILLKSFEELGAPLSLAPGKVTWYTKTPYPSDEDDSISEPLYTKLSNGTIIIQCFDFESMEWDTAPADSWAFLK